MRAYTYASHWWSLCSCVGVCHLAAAPIDAVGLTLVTNAMRAVTGWDTSLWELVKVGERAKALARAFNCREGFTAKDDRLPKRLHEAFTDGPLKGVRIDPETFQRAHPALPPDGGLGHGDGLADLRQAGRAGDRVGRTPRGYLVACRLLKKAHLRRWCGRALVAAYLQYASLGPSRTALHLALFEQPGQKRFSSIVRVRPKIPGVHGFKIGEIRIESA